MAGLLPDRPGSVRDVAFRPDGKQLASVNSDGMIRVWDMETRRQIATMPGGHYRIAYSADGRLLAASQGEVARLWDNQTFQEIAALRHGAAIYGLAFSPDGTRLATACGDNTIRLWDVAMRREVAELRGHEDYVHAVVFSPDGTRLLSASGDFSVRVWDTLSAVERARAAQALAANPSR
jgi:eukaryotic-like serine/threonine-protein kinase